ncbi:hypothetical protein LK07_27610 [Streptomyces pluripotens]|uniref:Uncharacterized protein n=1 Tax=Streptomyces pluripotens TaxID=1355015 RepID=A0A221P4N6_9ACTN|nr:hypothetical protein LK06_026450 [Streptomyces pluripotens]ASN27167.1 hypothetical protein LK07_27610 [Streptomyces pluripotens]KIE28871.1 hypothetical protein LK08_00310 [Streptomyces sp. MUSC 125]
MSTSYDDGVQGAAGALGDAFGAVLEADRAREAFSLRFSHALAHELACLGFVQHGCPLGWRAFRHLVVPDLSRPRLLLRIIQSSDRSTFIFDTIEA